MIMNPKMNTDKGAHGFGHCEGCGKYVKLRNSDGMVRNHSRRGRKVCEGSFQPPSKAATAVFQKAWQPPRRSN